LAATSAGAPACFAGKSGAGRWAVWHPTLAKTKAIDPAISK